MKPETLRRDGVSITLVAVMLTLVLAFIFIPVTSAEVTELNVNPQVVDPGDVITISGKAAPGEEVWIGSSFELPFDVEAGKYSRDFNVHFLKGEKTFSVTAEHVKNIRLSLSLPFIGTVEYPLEGPETATNGIATLSVSFPAKLYGFKIDISSEKNVKIYGDATDGATSVNLKIITILKSREDYTPLADSNGDFSLDINTEGVPEGEFLITAGEEEETVYIGVTPTSSSSNGGGGGSGASGTTPTLSPSPSPTPTSTPTPIETPPSTFTPAPTATPAVTSPPATHASASPAPAPVTPSPSPSPTPSQRWIPGFEAVFAIAGLLAVAYLVLRRRSK